MLHTITLSDAKGKHMNYERTTCDCSLCRCGCYTMPGALAPGDLDRMAAASQPEAGEPGSLERFAWMARNFRASTSGRIETKAGPIKFLSIVPAQKENGNCVFLKGDACTVHGASPYGCAAHDMHEDDDAATAKTKAWLEDALSGTDEAGEYASTAHALHRTGLKAAAAEHRKDAFLMAEAALRLGMPETLVRRAAENAQGDDVAAAIGRALFEHGGEHQTRRMLATLTANGHGDTIERTSETIARANPET